MLARVLRKLRFPLLGVAAGALVLTTTTALAGSGVGSVFNLGVLNTVDATTTLSGNPGGSPQLKLENAGTNAALRADSATGIGVNGVSVSGTGQQGQSQSGIGLLGIHAGSTGLNAGVEGRTASSDASGAGVLGRNTGGGPGLRAVVNAGAPPLAVNSSVKVTSLNADLLDGIDSSALQKRVSGTCAAGQAIRVVAADGSVTCEPVGLSGAWSLSGNAGTTSGSNFLGTSDNQALELKVNGARALRLEPNATSPNVIGGFSGNAVTSGAVGATVAGGGEAGAGNLVTDDFGAVGGGANNTAGLNGTVGGGGGNTASGGSLTLPDTGYSTVAGGDRNIASGGLYGQATVGGGVDNSATGNWSTVSGGQVNSASGGSSTVPGGEANIASGNGSFAAGTDAHALHDGSFVWADDSGLGSFSSTDFDQFDVRAGGGAKFVRGGSSFNAGIGAALQVENDSAAGEAGWFRIGSTNNTGRVISLVKPASGGNDFLTCWNESAGPSYATKCHIDQNGTFVSGSDFAESLRARGGKGHYQAGDVLSISRTKAGQVLKSNRPFDRALIGVYSTRPAVLGADKSGITRVGKQEIPVAITGIVPVKVTAQNGSIRPGDLLTSSSSPGRAMFAGRNPAVGTVLGKALGFLTHGQGTMRMLVMPR